MDFHMKTTLVISDPVMREVKRESTRTGRTMSDFVEEALRMRLQLRESTTSRTTLPSFSCGGTRVDVANREALYEAMER
jgi:hypothetical protein